VTAWGACAKCAYSREERAQQDSPLFLFADHAALLQSNILTYPWRDASGNTHMLI
jgi:hypothetical protein